MAGKASISAQNLNLVFDTSDDKIHALKAYRSPSKKANSSVSSVHQVAAKRVFYAVSPG